MFPAFAHFRRTATRDAELNGQQIKEGDKVVMWYVSSNRDESRYEDPDRFDVERNPEHQAFGAGGRHFCLGTALARLELNILFEETLQALPGDRARRRAGVRRLTVHQPARHAPGQAGPAGRRLGRAGLGDGVLRLRHLRLRLLHLLLGGRDLLGAVGPLKLASSPA